MDFALNEEQLEFKERCRSFAREVIRPAARKHDEEESTPWEVIKEARKQGLSGIERIQRSAGDPEGQMQVISRRGVPLGLRRHRAGDLRLRPRRRGHRLLRHPRADRASGSPSASAPATRSSSAPTR